MTGNDAWIERLLRWCPRNATPRRRRGQPRRVEGVEPDLVAITLRRAVAGTSWDIALTSDYYGRRTPPGQPHTAYFWEARRCEVDGYD